MAAKSKAERRLVSHVHVFNEKTGGYEVFGPDDKVPAWAVKAMGDHVWAEGDAVEDDTANQAPAIAPPSPDES